MFDWDDWDDWDAEFRCEPKGYSQVGLAGEVWGTETEERLERGSSSGMLVEGSFV